jgi:hypothetical protein
VTSSRSSLTTCENSMYLGSIISMDGGSSEDVKSRIAKARCVFSQLKKGLKNRKIRLRT